MTLSITLKETELFDEDKMEFVTLPEEKLLLEHSLISISKWESKWEKPFLSDEEKSTEEVVDYISCMSVNKNISTEMVKRFGDYEINKINIYISAPSTATTFSSVSKGSSREIITSELIYYWMVSFNIPFECQKWHLNRLLTLIRICGIKNSQDDKLSNRELAEQTRRLNSERRKALRTKG